MAVAKGKERIVITLPVETFNKLEELLKANVGKEVPHKGHYTGSNVLEKLIDERHEILKRFGE